MESHSIQSILVVEDCRVTRRLLCDIAQRAGYATREATNPGRVPAILQEEPGIALVLLDGELEGGDGVSLCEALRRSYSPDRLPIIMVSSRSDTASMVKGLEAGANDYVAKPIDRDVLRARIKNHIGLAAMSRRIVEQRMALEQVVEVQRALGDVLPQAIVVHDLDGRILYRNRLVAEWCRRPDLVSFDQLVIHIFDGALASFIEAEQKNHAEFSREVKVRHPLFKDIVVTSCAVNLSDGRPLRLWTFRDLTHTRTLERRASLQVTVDSVSTFVHGVAHNFNNILAGIMGSISLLSRPELSTERTAACLQVIKRSAEAGAKLTKKMMVMVREPSLDGTERPENVKECLSLLVDSYGERFGDRIMFDFDSADDLPLVPINLRNLADIFGNILTNAIDAIDDKGWIIIRARTRDQGRKVEVSISDNGCGMDERTLRRVLEPFFTTKNLDAAHNVSRSGNGLGLWAVYNLVRLLGGDLSIESALRQGTRVTITLPVAEGEGVGIPV